MRVVEIFYKRINTEQEPQYVVMKMQHYSPENIKWKYSQPEQANAASKQKRQTFQASVIVNSYIVEQDIKLFVPTFEDLIQPVRRNVLYPFLVYGGEVN